jgi:hypothetical protein
MAQLISERGGLLTRLDKVEQELSVLSVGIEALESSLMDVREGEATQPAGSGSHNAAQHADSPLASAMCNA